MAAPGLSVPGEAGAVAAITGRLSARCYRRVEFKKNRKRSRASTSRLNRCHVHIDRVKPDTGKRLNHTLTLHLYNRQGYRRTRPPNEPSSDVTAVSFSKRETQTRAWCLRNPENYVDDLHGNRYLTNANLKVPCPEQRIIPFS